MKKNKAFTMRFTFILLTGLLMLSSCKEEIKTVKKYSIDQFYKNESISGGGFSPDESKLLITSNKSGIYNLYSIDISNGEQVQLTESKTESIFPISYFPNDERILYSADQGGNEINHIYLRNTDGSITDLSPDPNAKAQFFGWARDNNSFFYASNKRDPRFFDLYEMDINEFKSSLIYKNDDNKNPGAISEDKSLLALVKTHTRSNSDIYLYKVKTKEELRITEHSGEATFSPAFFSLNNKYLYYTTDLNNEFTYLKRYDIDKGTHEEVFKPNWDIQYAFDSYNETYRVIGVNEDARTKLYVFNNETDEKIELPTLDKGNISSAGFSKSEKLMRLYVTSAKSTGDLYVYNIENQDLKQLTNTMNPEINADDLVDAEVVRYPSFDGMEIPAILYKPHIASKRNKVPALVWVHGGPGGQSRVGYFSLIQYLVNHGYAIIAVNNRGSSGYGKSFYAADDKKHGEADLQDCIYAKNFLKETGWVDMEKVGIIGGSYGGYMVMAALAFTPEEFDVGVNIFGVTNWLRTLKSIPPWWEAAREGLYKELGDPFTQDSVRLYKISPLFHAANVTKPLMVLQGANDPRVLQVESDEIVEAVKNNGVPVEYVLFPDEGHGFRKKTNEIEGYGKILTFLDKYLKEEKNQE